MAFATATTTPVAVRLDGMRFTAQPCEGKTRAWWEVLPRPEQDICLEDGEFQLTGPYGQRMIGRFTGRRRWVNNNTCHAVTIEVFDIDTVVEMVGELPVMVGRRGERLEGGTWWTHRNAVEAA
jgi:hypothetical protein